MIQFIISKFQKKTLWNMFLFEFCVAVYIRLLNYKMHPKLPYWYLQIDDLFFSFLLDFKFLNVESVTSKHVSIFHWQNFMLCSLLKFMTIGAILSYIYAHLNIFSHHSWYTYSYKTWSWYVCHLHVTEFRYECIGRYELVCV